MIEIFGKYYYIDIDSINEKCKTGTTLEDDDEPGDIKINIFIYEILKMCIERVLNDFDENNEDNDMAIFSSKNEKRMSVSFKLAFNTLIKNNIIIEQEYE